MPVGGVVFESGTTSGEGGVGWRGMGNFEGGDCGGDGG